ncbi:TIGR04104 family putative zinc finger protein [Lysinibacillus parviboronicapiens]|uniref:TIGR04104 family putative zinc finger protein n=1 Tax=Lysinibacillus parviboronicapiens TaxID=436516 RepID=UPI000D3B78B8|nr:TIGR04104 family putative zinc finger protein [Lysinibacillus parviboronicapiens]
MNQFKEDVLTELQDIKLSAEKKQAIVQKVHGKSKPRSSGQWQYRIVLATFTVFALTFTYLLSQGKDERTAGSQQAAVLQQETETASFWTFLDYDLVRGILLFLLFLVVTSIIKRLLRKKGYGLPVCIECAETWTPKQARKFYRKNGQIECPYCGKKQYRTKKSVQLAGILNIPFPMMIFMNQLFDNFFLGIGFFGAGVFIYYYQLAPYIFGLQEDDPMNEPLW